MGTPLCGWWSVCVQHQGAGDCRNMALVNFRMPKEGHMRVQCNAMRCSASLQ
jgi:hypothetical protein